MHKACLFFALAALMMCHSLSLSAADTAVSGVQASGENDVQVTDVDDLQLAPVAKAGWVPAGFEDLNEPQTMEVDIWYGGYFLTSSLARFTFEELQFLVPQEIIDLIPNLNDAEKIQSVLSQTLPTNSGLVCRSEFAIDCGALRSADVGIIFDRTNFRSTLFIGAENLSVVESRASRYLPDSSASLSAYSQNSLYFSGNEGQALSFNLSTDTQFALAENRLLVRSNWTDTQGFVFDSLGLQREYRGRNISAGLIRGDSPGFEFINSQHFIGVSLESSLTTRTDLDRSEGNDILLFLSSRSLLEVFRDGRLLYSGYYDVGNQLLNTSSLPAGSYDIEIKATDIAGNTSVDTRFYSKSARLAPTDQALYFFQVGSLVESGRGAVIPDQLGSFVRAGYRKRLSASMGAGLGISGTEESSLVELSVFKQGQSFEFSSGLAYENDNTLGVSAELRLDFDSISLDLSTRQILNDTEQFQSTDMRQLGDNQTEYRANLRFRSPIGMMNVFYRNYERKAFSSSLLSAGIENINAEIGIISRELDTEIANIDSIIDDLELDSFGRVNRNYGIRWNYNVSRLRGGQLRASAELSRNNDATLFVVGVTYNFGSRQRRYSLTPRLSTGTDEAGKRYSKFEGGLNTNWRMGDEGQHRLNLRAQRQGQTIVEANYQNTAANTANDVTARYDIGAKQLSYNGSLKSTVAVTSNSRAFGNSLNGDSAFLINIDAVEGDTSEYEVLVNGSPKGKTRAGQTLLVPVAPYETYRVEVVSRGDSLVNLKDNNFVKTVYPGNVIALKWTAQIVKVGYGRILGVDGKPVANAVITGAGAISMTDSYGYFQLEIGEDDDSFEVRKGTDSCRIDFNQDDAQEVIVPLGDLSCQ